MVDPNGPLWVLLGAGSSVGIGMPTSTDITRRVLSGEGVVHGGDGVYYFGEANPDVPDAFTSRSLAVARWTASFLERYFFPYSREFSYEDIAFVLEQVIQAVDGEYENPALQPFIDQLYRDAAGLLPGRPDESRQSWSPGEVVKEALRYLRDVVWHLLRHLPPDLNGLAAVSEACQEEGHAPVFVATLNHDVTLEAHLRGAGVAFVDGFGESINGIRYWEPERLDGGDGVRLLKLHGSIDWIQFVSDTQGLKVGIPDDCDVWHTEDITGKMQWPTQGRPEFLCGTFNKILDYQSPIYAELHFHFFALLKTSARALIAGYSFGDKAVNRRLWDWMQRGDTTMVVIHPDPGALVEHARPALADALGRWQRAGRLSFVAQPIEACSWADVANEFNGLGGRCQCGDGRS